MTFPRALHLLTALLMTLFLLPTPSIAEQGELTPEQLEAWVKKSQEARKAADIRKKAADALEARLPKVKRIYTCDEKPSTDDVMKGIEAVQKFVLPDCSGAYARCEFAQVVYYELGYPGRCSLRNSLAVTPNQLKASYPKDLLRTYVDALVETRKAHPDWREFTGAAEPLFDRLKEYMWVSRCRDHTIGLGDTVYKRFVDACDMPYYVMAKSGSNLDGDRYQDGYRKFPSYFTKLMDAEQLKDGDFIIADYVDIRSTPAKARFYRLKPADLSLTLLKGDELDAFTGTLRETDEFVAELNFDRETGILRTGGGNPHVGLFWGAEYALEGDRIVLKRLASQTEKGVKVFYSAETGLAPGLAMTRENSGNYYDREVYRHDASTMEENMKLGAPLTEEQKKQYREVLEEVAGKPLP